jgi:hypothetical protein
MKKLFLVLLASSCMTVVSAQTEKTAKKTRRDARSERINAMAKLEEEGVIGYKKHTVYGAKLSSDGYGGFIEIGRAMSVRKALLFQLDISERKHVKEEKQQVYSNTSPIIYGKINFFYPIKLGVQYQYLLGNKGNKNGVSVTANLGGGLSLGMLRPYMIDLDKQGERTFVKYESADSSYFLDQSTHIAGPGFGRGWSGLKFTPGLYIKPAVRFDYGKYNEMVSAIEVGLTAEYFTKNIPQMIYIEQKKLFFSAYFSVLFGRRK